MHCFHFHQVQCSHPSAPLVICEVLFIFTFSHKHECRVRVSRTFFLGCSVYTHQCTVSVELSQTHTHTCPHADPTIHTPKQQTTTEIINWVGLFSCTMLFFSALQMLAVTPRSSMVLNRQLHEADVGSVHTNIHSQQCRRHRQINTWLQTGYTKCTKRS